jgi:hypothetical protein
MPDLIPASPQLLDGAGKLSDVPTADLRAALARGLELTAETLTRLALIWGELERRGEDLRELRKGMARLLPLIAAGRLAAEAVVAFAGRPVILRALDGLPLAEQRHLAAGELVDVVDPTNPQEINRLPLTTLPALAISQVIFEGRIRSIQEQRMVLRERRKATVKAPRERVLRPRYDRATGQVKVGHVAFELTELLTELAGPERAPIDVDEEYGNLRVRITKDELKKLAALAEKAQLPEWELVRKAMRAFGLI